MISGIDKLDSVKQAFRHWRATRTKRGYIPDELWEQVKELLVDYTPSKIGIHLGLSPIQIKKKLQPQENRGLQFVEVKQKHPMPDLGALLLRQPWMIPTKSWLSHNSRVARLWAL